LAAVCSLHCYHGRGEKKSGERTPMDEIATIPLSFVTD
jgi:hypothetical protein